MKKEKEEMFEEIAKNKNLKAYAMKKLGLIMTFSAMTIGTSPRFFKDITNWDEMVIGGAMIIYSVWCMIEIFVELNKINKIMEGKNKNS